MGGPTDRIEKQVLLRAPHGRVWQAITDAKQFGTWFGVRFDGPFQAGTRIAGVIVPTAVDEAVAERQKPHEGTRFEILVDRIDPERLFSFRWHPFAIDPAVDYSSEPTTLVEFVLEDVAGGVMLTVTESGFDRIPLERRGRAFAANEGGWALQVILIAKYLAAADQPQ
jgi:uncharacterized protein YndB with AHSA1/START domain